MLLLSLFVWYFRRSGPLTLRDVHRCTAIILLNLTLVPVNVLTSSIVASEPVSPAAQHVLREGTSFPPTTGRIVMVGRRWAFVPTPELPETDDVASRRRAVSRAYLISETQLRATRLGSSGADYGRNRFHAAAMPISEATRQLPSAFEQITLQENLMLQRIVKAIQVDPTDDHWVISGEITEFFNENRLLIRLAQRANHH